MDVLGKAKWGDERQRVGQEETEREWVVKEWVACGNESRCLPCRVLRGGP